MPGTQNGAPVYRMTDHLGSTVGLLSASGAIMGTQDTVPFGQLLPGGGAQDTQFPFTELEHDPESGLDHAAYRQYASNAGRWMSPDPYDGSMDLGNPQSLNRYAYVGNNPLLFTDPTGLAAGCHDESAYDQDGNFLYSIGGGCLSWGTIFDDIGKGFVAFGRGVGSLFGYHPHPQMKEATTGHRPSGQISHSSPPKGKICIDSFGFFGTEADAGEISAFGGLLVDGSPQGFDTGSLYELGFGGEGPVIGGAATQSYTTGKWSTFIYGGGSLSAGLLAGGQFGLIASLHEFGGYYEGHIGKLATGGGYALTGCGTKVNH